MDIATKHLAAVNTLYTAFAHFNTTLFQSALPTPVINMAPGRSRGKYTLLGWFRPMSWISWETSPEDLAKDNDQSQPTRTTSEPVAEINICPDPDRNSPEDILETLIHEMVHLYNDVRQLKDCSKTGYHNKNFKSAAEEAGLEVERMGIRGWAKTSLSSRGQAAVDSFQGDLSTLHLQRPTFKIPRENPYLTATVKKADYEDKVAALCTHNNCESFGQLCRALIDQSYTTTFGATEDLAAESGDELP